MNLHSTPSGAPLSLASQARGQPLAKCAEPERLLLSAGARVDAAPTEDGIAVDLLIHLAWQVVDADAWTVAGPPQTALLVAAAKCQMRSLLAGTGLAALLVDREAIETRLQQALQCCTADRGLSVELVVIRQVDIPVGRQIDADVDSLCALRQCLERRRNAFC